eukprot:scaffold69631_cov23-Cyclotella_meneghiniana.AAC.3
MVKRKSEKEFAMVGFRTEDDPEVGIFVVASGHVNNDPSSTKKISHPGDAWLRKNRYTTYEKDLGDLLRAWLNGDGNILFNPPAVDRWGRERCRYPYKIYSRAKKQFNEAEAEESNQEMDH